MAIFTGIYAIGQAVGLAIGGAIAGGSIFGGASLGTCSMSSQFVEYCE